MSIKKIMHDLSTKNALATVKKTGLVNCFCLKSWPYHNKFGNIFTINCTLESGNELRNETIDCFIMLFYI